MTMMFSLLERQREKDGESERDGGEIAKEEKPKRECGKEGNMRRERNREEESCQ